MQREASEQLAGMGTPVSAEIMPKMGQRTSGFKADLPRGILFGAFFAGLA
jgi:hypothetical protein